MGLASGSHAVPELSRVRGSPIGPGCMAIDIMAPESGAATESAGDGAG
jgi:hypothetical protein